MLYSRLHKNECRQPEATAKAGDSWTHLLQRMQDRMKKIYFICIDGFDDHNLSEETTATISAIVRFIRSQDVSKDLWFRLFLSGSCETLSAIPRDDKNGWAFSFNLSQGLDTKETRESGLRVSDSPRPNADDIERVTNVRVLEVCNIKPDLKGILDKSNIQLLLHSISGNYLRLEATIAAIMTCDTERKVLDVINNSSDDFSTFQRNSLKALDSSLDLTRIRETPSTLGMPNANSSTKILDTYTLLLYYLFVITLQRIPSVARAHSCCVPNALPARAQRSSYAILIYGVAFVASARTLLA